MSTRTRERAKGRRNNAGSYSALPHDVFQSPQWGALSPRAAKLLIDVYCQYRGTNNGDLIASWSVMRKVGWTSKSQLAKSLAELEATRWLLRTRQGDINKPTLYAVTFKGIDHCGGKLEIQADPKPSHAWKYPEANTKTASKRKVKPAHRPDLHTGEGPPHGGAVIRPFRADLPRTEGRCVA